ncbi:Transcriptional corepressor SEUSS [Morella rubra]|uniref:Transcriptional corepressor SEUSS n=1 Tax=Morella rubra TaxID=262757 RepID=A0A6A1USD3_9ROSI|nr:Transcriptional corepressor SEUSS [Morella rubra]
MLTVDACSLVLAFIGIWLAFGRSQHHMHRLKACPFLLVQNKGFEVNGLGCGGEQLSDSCSSSVSVCRLSFGKMVPSGPPTPIGGAQSVSPSLLRSNSGMLGAQGGPMPSQTAFPSLMSPRTQFNNINMLGNVSNVSSLLNQSFGNGGPSASLSGPGSSQRGGIDTGAESDPLSIVGNGMGFNTPSSSFVASNMANPASSGPGQGQQFSNPSGNQLMPDQQQSQQLESQNFQHGQQPMQQFSAPHSAQQQQFQTIRGGLGGVGPVKLEPQVTNDQHGQQQLQSIRNLGPVKLEPQQIQTMRGLGPDNNIEFWRNFVAEYFAPHAKKKWCVSMYGSGRQTTGVFPQDVWHCEICNRKPGRGFEATVEVLPRLFKIKYESGTLEELLYVDMPREYHNASGQIVLDYAKAIQESVFEQLRVVRDGQLRIVFSQDLKICSWEFCARRHEELIPRRLLIPQVSQLGAAAQKYQAATQNASSNISVTELQNNCNMFVASARQLAKALEVPLVNDLGYTKRYVRCLQISEVVNSMKDLIDYSRETGTGPMESLAKFPRRTSTSSGFHGQSQLAEEHLQQQQQQQKMAHNSNGDQSSVQVAAMQLSVSNGLPSVNNSLNTASMSTSANTIVGLLHQNSMNSRQQSSLNNASSPYGGSSVQIPSPGSSSTIPQAQPNQSPFQSPTPSSNNPPPVSHGMLTAANHMSTSNSTANMSLQQPALSSEADPSDSQSSVQKILHEMMITSPLNGTGGMVGVGTMGNDGKNVNGILPTSNNTGLNSSNCLVGNGTVNSNSGIGGAGYGTMGGLGQSAMVNGIRAAMGNNSVINGRVGMASMGRDPSMSHQQQDLGNQLLSGLGAVNGFNNLQFDWKPSP